MVDDCASLGSVVKVSIEDALAYSQHVNSINIEIDGMELSITLIISFPVNSQGNFGIFVLEDITTLVINIRREL